MKSEPAQIAFAVAALIEVLKGAARACSSNPSALGEDPAEPQIWAITRACATFSLLTFAGSGHQLPGAPLPSLQPVTRSTPTSAALEVIASDNHSARPTANSQSHCGTGRPYLYSCQRRRTTCEVGHGGCWGCWRSRLGPGRQSLTSWWNRGPWLSPIHPGSSASR